MSEKPASTPAERARKLSLLAGWTDEREAVLRKLWAEGLSCSQIARKIGGLTRNAVIGKVHRLKLAGRVDPSLPRGDSRAPKVKRQAGVGGGTRLSPNVGKVKPSKPLPPTIQLVVTDPKPWLERRPFECAFPVSGEGADTHSCCAPVWEQRPYCKGHAERMYQKPRSEAQVEADKQRAARMRAGKARAA